MQAIREHRSVKQLLNRLPDYLSLLLVILCGFAGAVVVGVVSGGNYPVRRVANPNASPGASYDRYA